jgi:simple sugar transport system permease protein
VSDVLTETPAPAGSGRAGLAAHSKRRQAIERSLVTAASSVAAVLIAFAISGLLLLVTGKSPVAAYGKMLEVASQSRYLYEMVDRAVPYIISAIAFAIAAKMNLFNIGVQGQYLIGMFWAAVAGAYVDLPAPLHVTFVLFVAMFAGAVWAGIAGFLKVKLGVSEIISTIMLNAIALQLIDWLFNDFFRFDDGTGALDVRTKPLPETAWIGDLVDGRINGFLLVSLLVAAAYYVLVNKSRFGFRLRASGLNPVAASTSGVQSGRMVVIAMLISGAIAGLAGMQHLVGQSHSYGPSRPGGYGFNGLAVALLGRNHPLGIVLAALLWGFLDSVSGPLQLEEIPKSIVQLIQGITLLSVVIVNEAVSRWYGKRTTERAAAQMSHVGGAS